MISSERKIEQIVVFSDTIRAKNKRVPLELYIAVRPAVLEATDTLDRYELLDHR